MLLGMRKAIAAKDNTKVTYTRLIFDCYVSVRNSKMTYTNILFLHIHFLLMGKVTYIQGD